MQKRLEQDSWLNFEFFLSCELGMTVGELRNRMTDKEFIFYAAYFELKAEREKRHIEESKHRTR